MEIRASTRFLAILGDPVAQSLSPDLQNAACRALGLDAVYVALRVVAAALPPLLDALAAVQGAGNVTIPHKAAVERHLTRKTDLCARVGACNTFWTEQGALVGDNTDVAGIRAAVRAVGGDEGGRWLLIGTGGSARAVAVAAGEGGAEVRVRSRTPERAAAFVAWATSIGVAARVATAGETADVAVNASPLGLHAGDPLPLDPDRTPVPAAAVDLIYAPGETDWVRALRAAGARAVDGRVALITQGAAAFERFFAGTRAPQEVMRAAVERALAR